MKTWRFVAVIWMILAWYLGKHIFHQSFEVTILIALVPTSLAWFYMMNLESLNKDIVVMPMPDQLANNIKQALDNSILQAEANGFKKQGTGCIKSIRQLVYVASFTDTKVTTTLYTYNNIFRSRFALVSNFKNGCVLETTNDSNAGCMLVTATRLLQVFSSATLDSLIEEHDKAIGFLINKGFEIEQIKQLSIQDALNKSRLQLGNEIKDVRYWPIKLFLWQLLSRKNSFRKAIDVQFTDKTLKCA